MIYCKLSAMIASLLADAKISSIEPFATKPPSFFQPRVRKLQHLEI